ncbi:hypothetical protein [uncultured Corynebacterium sp.]|nr:hypothetical protein [uncultured Corynebacterium sp.]
MTSPIGGFSVEGGDGGPVPRDAAAERLRAIAAELSAILGM